MAEGFAKHLGADLIDAYSAGSRPSGQVNPRAVTVMSEVGIDISSQASKGFADLPAKEFDLAVTLGCQDICPFVPADKHIEWQIEDPAGRDMDTFRNVRDQIRDNVTALIKTIRR